MTSIYQWGPLGLVSRRGVSLRDGQWNPTGGKEETGAFEPTDPPNPMQDYTYMADAMGNIRGLFDSASGPPGQARIQTFDAFGNAVGTQVAVNASVAPPASPYVTFRVADDHDRAETHSDPCGLYPDPPNVPAPVERVQTGQFNWRGGEGSQTTFLDDDLREGESIPDYRCPIPENCVPCCDRGQTVIAPARTKPATGLVYMVNRYYEPETGRFTQADRLPLGVETLTGQNNRWVYCASEPVNLSDPSGLFAQVFFLLGGLIGLSWGGSIGFNVGYNNSTGDFITNLTATILSVVLSLAFDELQAACGAGSVYFRGEFYRLLTALGMGFVAADLYGLFLAFGVAVLLMIAGFIVGFAVGLVLGIVVGGIGSLVARANNSRLLSGKDREVCMIPNRIRGCDCDIFNRRHRIESLFALYLLIT